MLKFLSCIVISLACMYLYAGKVQDGAAVQEVVIAYPVAAKTIEVAPEQKIQLFIYENCSYCVKVTDFLRLHNILDKVVCIDAGVSENRELLRSVSGRTQAPYLVDHEADVKMPESLDIIAYFTKKFNLMARAVDTAQRVSLDDNLLKTYDSSTFLSHVQASQKPVIILVSTTWCPPCKVFKPIFLRIAEQFADRCEFICIDGDESGAIVDALGVRCYPSIVCYKHGQQINPANYRSKEGLERLVNQLLAD